MNRKQALIQLSAGLVLSCGEANHCGGATCSDVVVIEFDRVLPAARYRVFGPGQCSFEEPGGDGTCMQMGLSRDEVGRLRLVSSAATAEVTIILEANGAEVLRQTFRPVYEDYTVKCLGTCQRGVVTFHVIDFELPPPTGSGGSAGSGGAPDGEEGSAGAETGGVGVAGGSAPDAGSGGADGIPGECSADYWEGYYYRSLEPISTTCPYAHAEAVSLVGGREVDGACETTSESWTTGCEYKAQLSCSGAASSWTLSIAVADEQGDGSVISGTAHLEATADGTPCAGDYAIMYERFAGP